jgi:hypothetical protein
MVPTRPKLIYQATIKRKLFFRRFAWSLLATVASIGALVALDEAAGRGLAERQVLQIGGLLAVVVAVLFALRAITNLWRGLTRKSETLRFFDQGFSWTRGDEQYQYGWSKLVFYREGGHGLYIGKRPLLQWGAQRLKMSDGRIFKVTGAHGDTRRFANAVRRPVSDYTGVWMGRSLRKEKPVRLHRQLTLYPGGVKAGKHEVHWSDMETRLRNGRLSILQKTPKGKFKTVKSFGFDSVDNVGGFLELAHGTIRNYQRERFDKRESQEVARR